MKQLKKKLPFAFMTFIVFIAMWGCEEPENVLDATELSFNVGNEKYRSETRRVEAIYAAVRYFLYVFEVDGQSGFGFASNEIIVCDGDEMYLNARLFFDSAFDVGKRYDMTDVINDESYFCFSNYLYLSQKDEDSRDYYAKEGWIEFDSLEMSDMDHYVVTMRFEFIAEDAVHRETVHIKNGRIEAAMTVCPFCPAAYMRFIE